MHYLAAPEMNPTIEKALDRTYDMTLASVEGRRSATVAPHIQIVIRGSTSVITNVQAFPQPEDMLPDCMAAIRAAEGTRAQAIGYILIGSGIVLDETMGIETGEVSLTGIAVDRHSWGKAIISVLDIVGGAIAVTDQNEFLEHGLFTGTVFDPWDTE